MKKIIFFMFFCLSFNSYALPDQTDEINKKIRFAKLEKIEFKIMPMNYFELKKPQKKGFNFIESNKYSFYSIENNNEYQYHSNYSIENISKDAIAMLSTHILSFLLPESWAISLEYNIIENFKSGVEDEKFLINVKTEI
tara:strand:- start:68569 stop:68985 length:417 start_codon:yes stop_codon:yes gene_type:complete